MASQSDIFMGRVFLNGGYASHAHVERCLHYTTQDLDLAHVLVEQGLLLADQAPRLRQVAAHMQFLRGELLFAKILVDHGLVSKANVDRAFEIQTVMECRQRIAEILVLWQKLTPEQVEAVCDEQLISLAEEAATTEREGLGPAAAYPRRAPPPSTQSESPAASAPPPSGERRGPQLHQATGHVPVLPASSTPMPAGARIHPPDPGPAPSEPDLAYLDDSMDPDLVYLPRPSDSIFEEYSPAMTLPIDSAAFAASVPSLSTPSASIPAGVRESSEEVQRVVSADRLLRAFDSALMMAGMEGMLRRYNPAPGQAKSKPIQVIWDASQRCFKAPLAPDFAAGDTFQLLDGKVFRVESVTLFKVAGTACYQQLEAKAVGLVDVPLRDSWDGKIPGAQF